MTAALTHVFRHPVKSLGREALDRVTLAPGARLPGDRLWAVAHERAKFDGGGWAKCANFLRCTHEAGLMAITARFDAAAGVVELAHPVAGRHALAPEAPGAFEALRDWLAPVWSADLPAPTGIHSHADGLTDNPNPWLSVHNLATHRAVEAQAGRDLSIHRWRGNLWIDGLEPWQEFGWIGQEIRIGAVRLKVTDRIGRCKATGANPETGARDIDMLAVLRSWGHQDFGVFAEVVAGGEIAPGDPVEVPA